MPFLSEFQERSQQRIRQARHRLAMATEQCQQTRQLVILKAQQRCSGLAQDVYTRAQSHLNPEVAKQADRLASATAQWLKQRAGQQQPFLARPENAALIEKALEAHT